MNKSTESQSRGGIAQISEDFIAGQIKAGVKFRTYQEKGLSYTALQDDIAKADTTGQFFEYQSPDAQSRVKPS